MRSGPFAVGVPDLAGALGTLDLVEPVAVVRHHRPSTDRNGRSWTDLPTPTDKRVSGLRRALRCIRRGGWRSLRVGSDEPAIPCKRRDRQVEWGRSSAGPKCSNRTDLRLTLADLFYGSDLPQRPTPTSTDLVCLRCSALLLRVTLPRASSPEDAVAPHTGGGHPDEVRRHPLDPRLKPGADDRRALGLGIQMMRRSPH
jgi:hypothetical protein